MNELEPQHLGKSVAKDISERATQADKDGKFPAEDAALLRSSGFTMLNVPKSWGGPGFSLRDCLAAQLELAKSSTSTALVAGMNMQVLGNYFYYRHWSEEIMRGIVDSGRSA